MITRNQDAKATPCEPGVTRRVLSYNDSLMMCEIRFAKGARGNRHAHPHQQITYVHAGSLRFTLGDEDSVVTQGDSILIPPDLPHEVEALTDAVLVDVFSPMREDFL